jgi:hypothetical protein
LRGETLPKYFFAIEDDITTVFGANEFVPATIGRENKLKKFPLT